MIGNQLKIKGFQWKSIENQRNQLKIKGNPLKIKGFHGKSIENDMKSIENQMISMEIH